MRTKALFIYMGAILIVLIGIIVFSTRESKDINSIPDDSVHNQLNDENGLNPSKENVRSDFMKKYEELKLYYEENPGDTIKSKEYAQMLSQAHKKDQAILIYNEILNIDPNRIDIMLALGFEYYDTKQYDKAEEMTNRVITINSENPQNYYNLGVISLAKGDTAKAKNVWSSLIIRFPESEASMIAKESLDKLRHINME